ncbi:MAG TPA: VWA domain-containing protein [Terriglobales bacterium]
MGRGWQWVALSCFAVGSAYSQTVAPADSSNAVFKTKVPVVIEDVVVTDGKGDPVRGLHKQDFQIFEDGKPQTIASFEEHKGVTDQGALPPLPQNVFTNYPVKAPADSVNVVLLDTLNTPLSDQSKVRLQITTFLKSLPAGSHIAVFVLSSGLRMVQGFTSDASVLLAALNKNGASRPQASPLLASGPAHNLDADINDQLAVSGAGMPAAGVASLEKLQQFQNHTQNTQDLLRISRTLQALQELANFLTGVPGRKNVIWFSDSFPLSIIPGRGVQNYGRSLSEQLELRKTVNMLAAAQVAIYPISPEGLNEDFDSSESRVKSVSKNSWKTIQDQQLAEVTSPSWDTDKGVQQQDSRRRARQDAHLATMNEIATDTGGEAFYYTNGFREALARVISDGAYYYTISYSPIDTPADGRYRPIDVKLSKGNYSLAYRHGYFADEPAGAKKNQVQPPGDPLRPLMIAGIPDATQIVYKIRVLCLPPEPKPKGSDRGGKTKLRGPKARYGIDFGVLRDDLTFKATAEGQEDARIEIAVVVYDRNGNPANSIVKSELISLNPQLYAAFAKVGVQLHEDIDVPSGSTYLRTGIRDVASGKSGTLEIPLHEISSVAATQ